MTRPHVVVHSMTSADGRTDHFTGDVGLYYELAAGFPQDAVLTGSGTLVAAAQSQGISLADQEPDLIPERPETGSAPADDPTSVDDPRPLLVVVDSRGRLTRFAWLRAMPYWRDVLVLCSSTTSSGHLALLARHRVQHLVVGTDRVDLPAALEALTKEYGVRNVRVDSGGTLNGVLLRAGLVDEISLLLGPYAVGGRSARGVFVADDLAPEDSGAVTALRLTGVERLRGDVVRLRYQVER